MEGESSGVQQTQGQVGQGENQQQGGQKQDVGTQQKQGQQAPQEDQVSGGDDTDYVAQLKARDAEIEALVLRSCAKRWCQHLGKGAWPPPRIFSYHAETIGDGHMDTVAHETPAMSLADMPTTDEGTIDFRRLAVRLVEQCVNAAKEMAVDELAGEGVRRNGYRERRLRTVIGEIRLGIPRLREGSYFPDEVPGPYSRTDRAMAGAIAEVYKLGLSTRKIERAAAELEFGRLSPSAVSRMIASLNADVATAARSTRWWRSTTSSGKKLPLRSLGMRSMMPPTHVARLRSR